MHMVDVKAKLSRLNLQLTPKAARPDRGGTTASKRQDDHVGSTPCTSSESKSRQATIGDVEVTSDPKIVRTAHREVEWSGDDIELWGGGRS